MHILALPYFMTGLGGYGYKNQYGINVLRLAGGIMFANYMYECVYI